MHIHTRPMADDSAVARFGKAFAEACMMASVEAAERGGYPVERLRAESDQFCKVIREEAVAELKWVREQGREVLDLVEDGRLHAGYLDLTFKAAVAAVASRSLSRMEDKAMTTAGREARNGAR